jgi:transposase
MQTVRSFVGMDVHKETISISVAEDGRNGPVRFIGVIPNQPDDIAKMAKRLAKHGELDFCYEAGGCGYNIYRQLTALGHSCTVAATSLIPRKPGERIKTDRRDSQKLAILHRSGDLTKVWVPDATHEALRDLVRARVDASMHLMRARQQLLAFLLRHGRSYPTGKHWTQRHRSWLAGQTFQQEVHRIVFQDYVETVWTAQERRDALIERIGAMTASWSLGPLVEALRGLRGIDLLSAATFICTTGDLSRFESPRMLMGYLGLVPSEGALPRSRGARVSPIFRASLVQTGLRPPPLRSGGETPPLAPCYPRLRQVAFGMYMPRFNADVQQPNPRRKHP